MSGQQGSKGDSGRDANGPVEQSDASAALRLLADRLLQAREAQGISRPELAQRLHMGLQQLEALEQADINALPEPVFVIAQARRVADALGLEISDSIDRLRSCDSFAGKGPALRPEAFARSAQGRTQAPAPAAPAPTAAAAGAPAAARPAAGRPPQPRPLQTGSVATRALRGTLLLALGAGVSIAAWQLQRRSTPALSVVRPATPAPPATPAVPAAVPAAVPEPGLVLQARQPSWLEVRSQAGGAVLFRGTLVGERRFALAQGLRVLAGRPDLVMVTRGGGKPQVLGPISAVRWINFGSGRKPRS